MCSMSNAKVVNEKTKRKNAKNTEKNLILGNECVMIDSVDKEHRRCIKWQSVMFVGKHYQTETR